jgi:hypothetical protein
MCQPVYELWLANEVAAGRIAAPGYFTSAVVRHAWSGCQWVGDGPGSLDPSKEVAAAKERVALGISTLQAESILHDGVDWETKHAQQVKERRMRLADGLDASAPAEPASPTQDEEAPDANTSAIAGAMLHMAAAVRATGDAAAATADRAAAAASQVRTAEIGVIASALAAHGDVLAAVERVGERYAEAVTAQAARPIELTVPAPHVHNHLPAAQIHNHVSAEPPAVHVDNHVSVAPAEVRLPARVIENEVIARDEAGRIAKTRSVEKDA